MLQFSKKQKKKGWNNFFYLQVEVKMEVLEPIFLAQMLSDNSPYC